MGPLINLKPITDNRLVGIWDEEVCKRLQKATESKYNPILSSSQKLTVRLKAALQ